jgi:hypothetical protein
MSFNRRRLPNGRERGGALSPAARFDRLVRPAEFGTFAALTLSGPG